MPLLDYSQHPRGRRGKTRMANVVAESLAVLSLVQLSACAKPDQSQAESRASVREIAQCPQYQGSTQDWRATPTADGRLLLLLPRSFAVVQTDSGQMWASRAASISYRRSIGNAVDTASAGSKARGCSESLGEGAQMRYYHARAATGEGEYLQASFRMTDGTTLRLIGLAQDSGGGAVLLAIARTARVKTP